MNTELTTPIKIEIPGFSTIESADFYLKSEADNVISTIRAERDEYRYNLSCARNEIHNLSMSMREDVKRIADKDKEIVDLKEKHKTEVKEFLYLIRDKENNFNRAFDSQEKEILHQKYKRCLAMARWCESENYTACWYHENSERCEWTEKWLKRWLKIAEKFKEKK